MKALLVIDMPDSCSQCEYLGEATSDENIKACTLSQLFFHKDFDIESGREVICPLKPMPNKRSTSVDTDLFEQGVGYGWNACLRAVLGVGEFEQFNDDIYEDWMFFDKGETE